MLNFTSIDFETANSFRGSPCSVGLVKVRDGQCVDTAHWLMRPPLSHATFNARNVGIHGITQDMVADQPPFKERLQDVQRFTGDDTLVAHNASFDMSVMRRACEAEQLTCPQIDFLCSMVLARQALSLPSYSLPFVADACGVDLGTHHMAADDATAAALITVELARSAEANTIEELAGIHRVNIGHLDSTGYSGATHRAQQSGSAGKKPVAPDTNQNADPNGYLFGRTVVFTGKLSSMTRQEAWDRIAAVGGTPEETTTRRTNVLVVGSLDSRTLRPGATLSGKAAKAVDLQQKGHPIEIMTEEQLLEVLP